MQVFPTAYFAPIAYYQLLLQAVNPFWEIHEHFVKQSIRTRCEILGPNGLQVLSIPVKRIHGNKTAMIDVLTAQDDWKRIHWNAIQTAYASSPFFDYYGMEIRELIFSNQENLIEFNWAIHQRICTWLDLTIPLKYSSKYIDSGEIDFRLTAFDTRELGQHKPYHQVFQPKEKCIQNLSVLDLILNEGPMARTFLMV